MGGVPNVIIFLFRGYSNLPTIASFPQPFISPLSVPWLAAAHPAGCAHGMHGAPAPLASATPVFALRFFQSPVPFLCPVCFSH